MPRVHVANIVVAFLLRNARTTSLDLLARVSVLEGIVGVKPGAWMKDTIPKREIVEVFGPYVLAVARLVAEQPPWHLAGPQLQPMAAS